MRWAGRFRAKCGNCTQHRGPWIRPRICLWIHIQIPFGSPVDPYALIHSKMHHWTCPQYPLLIHPWVLPLVCPWICPWALLRSCPWTCHRICLWFYQWFPPLDQPPRLAPGPYFDPSLDLPQNLSVGPPWMPSLHLSWITCESIP